ncbi:MAG: hypothetical protein OEY14_11315 [Myxococcales bacterium]|nr:hypothetical protein [Myxococcales bacterium]
MSGVSHAHEGGGLGQTHDPQGERCAEDLGARGGARPHALGPHRGGQSRLLERLRIAPRGTRDVSHFPGRAPDALVEGGQRGIFTPMYDSNARKPEQH